MTRELTRDERGSASLMVIALAAVVLMLGVAGAFVTAMVAAHRQGQAAADLAALAGAAALRDGGDPCAVAGGIAGENGATLTECWTSGSDVLVQVGLDGPAFAGHGWRLTGRARAGPAAAEGQVSP